jgi:hypothetical protein
MDDLIIEQGIPEKDRTIHYKADKYTYKQDKPYLPVYTRSIKMA